MTANPVGQTIVVCGLPGGANPVGQTIVDCGLPGGLVGRLYGAA